MSYRITDHIVTSGNGAKEAYLYAKEISSAWNLEYNKSAELLKTKKYIIIDKTQYTSSSDVLKNIDYLKLSQYNLSHKIAACYILTDNRYLFISFVKDNLNYEQ